MDEKLLKKIVMNVPFSYPLAEGTTIQKNANDPKLQVKCCYLTVVNKGDHTGIEVFIKPDTYFVITKATYNYDTFEMTVVRQLENISVHYNELPDYIGQENMSLIDDRLSYYLFKSL
ncbi:hypothetical protein QJ48_28700 [Paenibacillus sp. A3]|uniref:hypothetical protein n=1 Tax=Paenibacillus sp. A3 TaxID=1337054 RepID=UPI0006D581D6|nr:hypothetical protein [Paenibacillus sp. A3]KPV56256.1 hypothetical protein QJ48_28700 [Paenibacillus sp. A3]